MGVWDWLRDLDALNSQRERDRRRREHQGNREGYARSGEPSPVPTFPGPSASGARLRGIETAYEIGTGGTIYVDINSGPRRTWIYNSVHAVIGGVIADIDSDYYINAQNGALVLATILYSEHVAGPSVSHQDVNYAPVPSTRLRLFVKASTLGEYYVLTGIWEEDR